MRSSLLLALLLGATPAMAQGQVDPAIHKLCSKVADYVGCVNANSSSISEAIKDGKGAKEVAAKNREKRTYTVNVFLGAATQSCFFFCSNNSEGDQASTIPKCYARDENLISRREFEEYLQEQGVLVSVVATSQEEKFTLANNSLGQISAYAACHYRPTIVEVYSLDTCDAPKRKDRLPQECQTAKVNLISIDKVEGKEAAKGQGYIHSWIGRILLLPGKILNATNLWKYDPQDCARASKEYLKKKMDEELAGSFVHAHHSIIDQLKDEKLVRDLGAMPSRSSPLRTMPLRGYEPHAVREQYKKGIFLDEKGPIGTRLRTLCSYGKPNNDAREGFLQAVIREKDLSKVKEILQVRRLPFTTHDGVRKNLGSGYFAGFSFDRSTGQITDLTHSPAKEQLKIGDEIVSINGTPIMSWVGDFDRQMTLAMKIKRNGKTFDKSIATKLQEFSD